MTHLKELIPDAVTLIDLHPADLGGHVLKVLVQSEQRDPSIFHRRNFCSQAGEAYRPGRGAPMDRRVLEACTIAWSWLEVNWFITKDPEKDNDWFILTNRGREVGDASGVRAFVERSQLPEHLLHPSFVTDVYPLYLSQRFDLAVFEAFHALEVRIREAAGLEDRHIGTGLASRAFNPEGGPLTDHSAEGGEKTSLMNLMVGAIGSYKNPQSHRRVGLEADEAREMIIIASHLLKIVDARKP